MWKQIRSNLVYICLGFAILIIIWYNNRPSADFQSNNRLTVDQDEFETIVSEDEPLEKVVNDEVIVDIKGAVKYPGVYEMEPKARVNDVVEKAGGFTKNAAEQLVNLAEIVYDEMHIIIPTIDNENMTEQSIIATDKNSKIRINQADQAALETLNGIGPSKAEAIIQYRDEHGPFKSIEDLLNVTGIGEKTLEGFRDDIQIP